MNHPFPTVADIKVDVVVVGLEDRLAQFLNLLFQAGQFRFQFADSAKLILSLVELARLLVVLGQFDRIDDETFKDFLRAGVQFFRVTRLSLAGSDFRFGLAGTGLSNRS